MCDWLLSLDCGRTAEHRGRAGRDMLCGSKQRVKISCGVLEDTFGQSLQRIVCGDLQVFLHILALSVIRIYGIAIRETQCSRKSRNDAELREDCARVVSLVRYYSMPTAPIGMSELLRAVRFRCAGSRFIRVALTSSPPSRIRHWWRGTDTMESSSRTFSPTFTSKSAPPASPSWRRSSPTPAGRV